MWDEKYFTELESKLEATKVWVCGPPIMQEGFDRASMAINKIRKPKFEFAAL